nr:MAG TPA: putative internal virion protein B [Caudoviricetes sp.]
MSGVVIGVGAAIGAVVGGGGSLYGISKQNRSMVKAFKKQMHYLQLNYNYNQASLDRQERSMYDSALGELFSLSLNAYQNNSQIEAAIAETGLDGRSQDKIKQTISGQTLRQETATKEAYLNDVWNVRFQKDALYIQTKASVEQARDNLNNNLIGGSRAFQQFLSGAITGAAMGAATAGVGSAVGGALGGAASSATTSTATGASAGIGGAGAVSTSLGSGFLSSYGLAANSAVAGGATTAASTGVSSGALAGIGGAGTLASTGISGASSSASIASNTSGNFLGNVVANYQQYKPYVDFVQQWANYYNSNITPRKRGGYFY